MRDLIHNGALRIEQLALQARTAVFDAANRTRTILPELEAELRDFARRNGEAQPLPAPTIGFDKPANVYLVSELYKSGGHRVLLEQMIAARPGERHIVLFTGLFGNKLDYSAGRMREIGAFPVIPDPDFTLYDSYLWLRNKLAAYAAQRIILFHHPEDILAAAAAYEMQPRYGRKLYVVRHSDTRPTLGAELLEATHIAIRAEQAAMLAAELPGLVCHTLPLGHSASRASTRLLDTGFFHDCVFTTATAGGEHKFEFDGPLAFGEVVAGIVRASRGRHIHIGAASSKMKKSAHKALDEAKLPHDRLIFAGEVSSIADTLDAYKADLYISSFPIGGGLTVTEVASAGVPVAVYQPEDRDGWHYISGAGHRPPNSLLWSAPDDLFEFLRRDAHNDILAEMARSSIDWYNRFLSPARFASRLAAIYTVTEGRMRGLIADFRERVVNALVDPDHYRARHKDVAAAKVDPKKHYLKHGENERRSPTSLFNTDYYLAQLSEGERKLARKSPITHYAMRGELRGLRPHPLFDPVLCGMTLRPDEQQGLCVLGSYIAADRPLRTHMFFDGAYYARRRVSIENRKLSLLAHFIEFGAELMIGPHPLIDMQCMGKKPLEGLLNYVRKDAPALFEPAPDPLFNLSHFCGGKPEAWAAAAPNLLWAYLITGNRRGTDPHRFVSVERAARSDSSILLESRSLLEMMATGDFAGDTHPLISTSHIRGQAPWLREGDGHPTHYFLHRAVQDNIDPHPYFSVQFYLYSNPDVARAGVNPLEHYLSRGEAEGRKPHPFFDGSHYYHTHLGRQADQNSEPLLHYILGGAGRFLSVLPQEAGTATINERLAEILFRQGDDAGAATLLQSALHPVDAPRHPDLVCEALPVVSNMPDIQPTYCIDPLHVAVRRPAIVHTTHIAPPSGSYMCEGQYATRCRGAVVIGGSDGVVLEDGRWFDPGLGHFDPDTMQVKENSSVVAVSPDRSRTLIRYHKQETKLRAGIFACGTYSHNYYHFLLEVVPRVMAADGIAPAGTPILADDRMPAQHFQILRQLFPHRAIRRLARGFSYAVDDLYIGNMANIVHDAVESDMAPSDAVRYHPDIVRRFNDIARGLRDDSMPRKIYFKRESTVRRMLDASALEEALRERGFRIVRCDQISFARQVQLAANADIIVAQSGAHLANILFARPGTRIFALYSNAPGTNYYLWDGIGRALGLEVINVAGWRIVGSTPRGIGRVHEDFTLPLANLLPFLPLEDEEEDAPPMPEDIRGCLDALYAANAEADTITCAWTVTAGPTPDGFERRLKMLRALVGTMLEEAEDEDVRGILNHRYFVDFGRNIRSGFVTQADHDDDERALLDRLRPTFAALAGEPDAPSNAAEKDDKISDKPLDTAGDEAAGKAEAAEDWTDEEVERILALTMLYLPAYRMPLLPDVTALPPQLVERYVAWLVAPPFLFRKGDDATYTAYAARLLDWFEAQLAGDAPVAIKAMLYRAVTDLDLGLLFLVDQPLRTVNAARNRLLDHLAPSLPEARLSPRPTNGTQGKRRIGILCRTFDMGPDSEAIVSFFRAFDRSKYEIYAYSVGFRDRVVSPDPAFTAAFDAVIQHRRQLVNDPAEIRACIVADELDIFLHANATTYGLRAQELAFYHRVAPIQMVLNSHVPMPFGFASFDAYLTGRSDRAEAEIAQKDYAERLIRCDGPVICYLNSLKPRPEPLFDRAALGLSDDDIVLMNAGSLSKLRHDCLRTMMLPLRDIPSARLLLAPYNPGWVARSQAFAFNRQIAEMAQELGIDPSRITVLGELSIAEAESALALCDIYLNPFPHGGATMTHLALISGKPPITLRRRSTRSIDQFLIQSLGLHDVLASSEAEYVQTICRLATDHEERQTLSRRIAQAARTPPFVNNRDYALAMQEVMESALNAFARQKEEA